MCVRWMVLALASIYDPATPNENEAQRCEDGVCQAPCDDRCELEGVECVDGYCATSNVGGPCRSDLGCVSPHGQGRCLTGLPWRDGDYMGTCVIASCDAAGMEWTCTEGKRCLDPALLPLGAQASHPLSIDSATSSFVVGVGLPASQVCVASCVPASDDCEGADACQGEAVGCRVGFACVDLDDGSDEGVCLGSCSDRDDPDDYCDHAFGPSVCDLDRGVCVP